MAMSWLVLVALVAACEGHPGQIRDLDDEFYSEVRDLLSKHAIHQVSTADILTCQCSVSTFGPPPPRKHVLPYRKYEVVLTKLNNTNHVQSECHETQSVRKILLLAFKPQTTVSVKG